MDLLCWSSDLESPRGPPVLMHRVQGSEAREVRAAWNGGQGRSQGLESGHRPLTPGLPSTFPGQAGSNQCHSFREWS